MLREGMNSMDLENRVHIVTGGGQGIGRACALALAAAGAHVAVADIDPAAGNAVVEEIAAQGGPDALSVPTDVGDLEQIDRMVATTTERFGRLDVLVNNAGVTRRAYIMDLREEDFDRIHRVNVKGVFFCLQRVAEEMIPHRDGVITNIASIAGRGFAGTSNAIYAASKGAVISLTKTAAQQLARHNLNVNSVCPGVVRTPLYHD
ncbi:MAG: SDR family NAD(P)-dependent oxidoreductase, partial [Gammaproteobacteria bacterium]|nr:SDR family NAD(P)-dependent oxidoreductase [Gammaproteobacteria bacterium]